jgi:EmrB/QacA subfamily drug resistance transporter
MGTPLGTGVPVAPLTWGRARARWVLAATVLGSALTFVDMTAVPVALPAVGAELGGDAAGLTWVANAYTLAVASLVLLGGSLGDRYGRRRIFLAGTMCFSLSAAVCALAPDLPGLILARAAQGIGGALLAPASIAILEASFAPADRARAIGAWTGLTAVATATGPFVAGWIVQAGSWRWVFLVHLPVAAAAALIAHHHLPESRNPAACVRLDVPGAALLVAGLGALTFGLTAGAGPGPVAAGGVIAGAVLLLGAFLLRERRAVSPLLPPAVFASRPFVVANLVTFVAYAAMGTVFFALPVALQVGAGLSPLAAGLSLSPFTLVMLVGSAATGRWAGRAGARRPVVTGLLVAALGAALLGRAGAADDYVRDVLLPVAVFGAGLTLYVTPLTAASLAALPDARAGLASGVNNAVARTGGLLAVAAVPLVGGLGGAGLTDPERVRDGFALLAWACAGLLTAGALLSSLLARRPEGVRAATHP